MNGKITFPKYPKLVLLDQFINPFMNFWYIIIVTFIISITIMKAVDGLLFYIILVISLVLPFARIALFLIKFKQEKYFIPIGLIKNFNRSNVITTIITFSLLFILIFTPHIFLSLTYNSDSSEIEMKSLVSNLTKNLLDDGDKVNTIIQWFNRGIGKQENISNFYYRFNQEDVTLLLYSNVLAETAIYSKYPFIAMRLPCTTDNWHNWIFHTRSGRCGEYARLFLYMCNYSDIECREIHCDGEDHVWNEVNIDNKWYIVDATSVNLPNNNGFNLSYNFMEKKVGGDWCKHLGQCENRSNVTYVYALKTDNLSKKIDVTSKYTNMTNISVKVTNHQGIEIDNATIKVKSYNRYGYRENGRFIGMHRKTNIDGEFIFILGGGDLEFIVTKGNFKGKMRDSFEENQNYNLSIILK